MNELYHFGVKGMHWGRRRYQNEDGSYTAQGRGRYDNGSIFSRHYSRKSEKYANRAKDTEKSIKQLSKYRDKGIKDKNGKLIADKRKVASAIKGYEKARDKARTKAEYYRSKSKGGASDRNLKSLVNKGYANTKGGQKQREERIRKLKKAAKIGAGVAAAGLAAYGGYKLHGAVKSANRKLIARDLAANVKATKSYFDEQLKTAPEYQRKMNRISRERNIDMLYEQARDKMQNDSFATAVKQLARDRKARKRARHDAFSNGGSELYHFGVKGMHWGVRHDRTPSGSSRRTNKTRTDRSAARRDNIKRAVKVGAAATALGLAMYGAYRLGKNGSLVKPKASTTLRLTDSLHKKKPSFGKRATQTIKRGVKNEFKRDIQRTKKIPKVLKRAAKAGKEGFKEGLEKGVRSAGMVIGTGAVMGGTEYLLKRRLGEKEGGKVFSYGRQPIKKK